MLQRLHAFRSQEPDASSPDASPAAVVCRTKNIPHDLLTMHDPGVDVSVVISLCSDPMRIEGYNPVHHITILGRAGVEDYIPPPQLLLLVRKNLQDIAVPEDGFHAGAGVGDVDGIFGCRMCRHHVRNGRT